MTERLGRRCGWILPSPYRSKPPHPPILLILLILVVVVVVAASRSPSFNIIVRSFKRMDRSGGR